MPSDARKSVLITGCSENGIGHSLALAFHRRGLRVIATARRVETLKKLSSMGIETFRLDVNDASSIDQLHQKLDSLLAGRLNYLVNNAGIDYAIPAIEADISRVQALFQTNVLSLMQMCQSFSDFLIAAGGTIVNHSSVLGTTIVVPFGSHYNASKAAVLSYSDTLRVEMAPLGVHVVTLITGEVDSNVLRSDPTLPTHSLYKSIESNFAKRAGNAGESQGKKMSTDTYAESVASKILQNHPVDNIWQGTNSWMVWFLTTFVPRFIHIKLTTAGFELWRVKRDHQLHIKTQ